MHDVFISYSSKNDEYAHAISSQLEEDGIKCWYAPRNIDPGDSWATAIVNAIGKSKVFIIVFSEQSNSSKQVLREINVAADKNCYIIPFRIDNTKMEGGMEYYLQSLHWMDAYARSMDEAIAEMSSRIKTIIGKDGTDSVNTGETDTPEEVTAASADNDIDAKDVVEEEIDNCELLGVSSDFKPSDDREEIEDIIYSDDEEEYEEDEEDDSRLFGNRIQKIIDWFVLVGGIMSILLLIWGYAYPPVMKWINRDKIHFAKISKYGDYSYPFYGDRMFISGMDMLFTVDTKAKKMALVKTDTGYAVEKDIDYKYDDPFFSNCYAKEDSDIVYFLDSQKNTVKIYDRGKNKWISSKGISLKLSATEAVNTVLYNQGSLGVSKDVSDDIIMIIYDYKEGAQCFSKLIRMKSDGSYETDDILQHKLQSYIGIVKSDSMLVWTVDQRLAVCQISDGSLLDITQDEIAEKYVSTLVADCSVVSPDKRFICRQKKMDNALSVTVWEVKTGEKVFSSTFAKDSSAYFSKDSKLLCYDRGNIKLFEYTLGKEVKHNIIFDKNYFINNDEFIEYPDNFLYSAKHDVCFFNCIAEESKGKYKDKLVMTDLKGNIVGQGEEIELPGESSMPHLYITDDKIFCLYNMTELTKKFKDGTQTMIYRAMYSVDDEGNYTFE